MIFWILKMVQEIECKKCTFFHRFRSFLFLLKLHFFLKVDFFWCLTLFFTCFYFNYVGICWICNVLKYCVLLKKSKLLGFYFALYILCSKKAEFLFVNPTFWILTFKKSFLFFSKSLLFPVKWKYFYCLNFFKSGIYCFFRAWSNLIISFPKLAINGNPILSYSYLSSL